MTERLLIVDDDQSMIRAYTRSLRGVDIDIRTALTTSDALQIARDFRPRAATLDYDIDAMTGSELGHRLRQMLPEIRLAGITGGDPSKFDAGIFSVRASKQGMDTEKYRSIVQQIIGTSDVGVQSQSDYKPSDTMVALCILMQGYTVGCQLLRGEQPIPGVTLAVPSAARVRELLDLSCIGITPDQLRDECCKAGIISDTAVRTLIDCMESGQAVDETVARSVDDLLRRLLQ